MSKQKKREKKSVKIFTLDTETRGLFGDIFRIGLYDGQRYYPSNSFKEIKNVLYNYSINYDCHVFIHNLDFDLSKMAHDLIPSSDLNHSVFINNNVTFFKSSVTLSQADEENEIISQPITFHDSNKLIPGRLKKICKDFNIEQEKAKIELRDHIIELGWAHDKDNKMIQNKSIEEINDLYDEFNSEGYYFKNVDAWEAELNEYLRMDCVSLYEVVSTLLDISQLPIDEFLKCPTTASLAMTVFKTNYPDDYKKAVSTFYRSDIGKSNEKFIRESYCGGRTEVFTPYLKDGYHYDVNSLYPYVMKTFAIPFGKPKHYVGDAARNTFKYWYNTEQGAGFLKCDIDVPNTLFIPPLPVKRKGKLIFPVGHLSGTWTFDEIKLALEMGCKINKIYECLYFGKVDYIFKDFIEYFEKIKTTSEGAKKTFAKLMQNSLYGKFGMRRIRKTFLHITELAKCEERFEEDGLRYFIWDNPLVDGGKFLEAEVESKAEYIQPHIAAYVTSLARIVLYKGLMAQYKKGIVSYCDTDSIAGQAKMIEDMIHDKEYGKWKLESIIKEGLFIQPKLYYENGLVVKKDGSLEAKETKKWKGVPSRKMQNIDRDTYHAIFDSLIEIQKKIENGQTKFTKEEMFFKVYDRPEEKRIKFATNLKHPVYDKETGEITFDKKIEVPKRLNLLNMQKRNMDYINNTSKPHRLEEW